MANSIYIPYQRICQIGKRKKRIVLTVEKTRPNEQTKLLFHRQIYNKESLRISKILFGKKETPPTTAGTPRPMIANSVSTDKYTTKNEKQ